MRRWCHITDDLLLVAGLIVLLLVPHAITSDGELRFKALTELCASHTIPDSKYSMIGPILSAPLWYIGSALWSPERCCKYFNWCVLVAFLAGLEILLRRDVDRTVRRRFQLLIVAGSMFAVQQKDFFAEIVTAVGVLLGFLALHQNRWWGGVLIAFGAANVPASIPAAGLVVLYATWQSRRLRYLLIGVAMIGLVLLENTVRRGGPLNTGYENDHGLATMLPFSGRSGFSYPFALGVMSILFSFGKGLVFFAPGLTLPVQDTKDSSIRTLYIAGCIFTAGLVLTYARWWAWYGGWCWGPRFFLAAAIPASIALAIWLSKEHSAIGDCMGLACLALSCWVGFTGAVCDQCDLTMICCTNNFANEHLTWYVPEFSVLWRPLIAKQAWTIKPRIAAVYWLVLFAWMAGPVVVRLLLSVRNFVANQRQSVPASWRW